MGTAASCCAGKLVEAREMCPGPESPSSSRGFVLPTKPYRRDSAPQHPFCLSWAVWFVPCPSSSPKSGSVFVHEARLNGAKTHISRLTAMFFSVQDQRLVGVSSLRFHVPVWGDVNVVSPLSPARGASKPVSRCLHHLSI